MKNKMLALFLAVLVVMGIGVYVQPSYASDISGHKYEKEISLLTALEILNGFEDGSIKPDNFITRAEFTKMMVKMTNLQPIDGNTKFSDVSSEHWAAPYINAASASGIIGGYTDNTFLPDNNIIMQDAVKIIVALLGYTPVAEQQGGYPGGYLSVASSNGILKKLSANATQTLTRGEIALLVYNSLTVDLLQQTGFGSDAKFEIIRGENILTKYFNIITRKGIVEATYHSGSSHSLSKGQVVIDNTIYYVGKTDIEKMLGMYVTIYAKYDKDDDIETLIHYEKSKQQEEITIYSDQIEDTTTNREIVYRTDKDGQLKKVRIPLDATVVFNGKELFDYSKDDLMPKAGQIVVIDDGNFIKITSYKDFVVDGVNKDDEKIYTKYFAGVINLSEDSIYTIYKDGKKGTLADLASNDIISVAASKDNLLFEISASSKSITGIVNELSDDYIKIDEQKYVVSKQYQSTDITLKIGLEATFGLDVFNEIVFADTNATSAKGYAFIAKMAETSGIGNNLSLRILDGSGSLEDYTVPLKLKLNDETGKTPEDLKALITKNNKLVPQLVQFKYNSKKEIVEIKTAMDNSKGSNYDEKVFSKDVVSTFSPLRYKSQMLSNGANVYRIPLDTVVFRVGYDQNGAIDEDTLFISNAKSEFKADNRYSNVVIYDLTSKDLAASVIVKELNDSEGVDSENDLAIIDSISKSIDQTGESVDLLNFYANGQKQSVMVENGASNTANSSDGDKKNVPTAYKDVKFENLSNGDVIQFTTNYKGNLSNFRPVYIQNIELPDGYIISGGGTGYVEFPTFETFKGKLIKKTDLSINLKTGTGESLITLGNPDVYRFNKVSKRIELLKVEDLGLYQYDETNIFVHLNRKSAYTIVVY